MRAEGSANHSQFAFHLSSDPLSLILCIFPYFAVRRVRSFDLILELCAAGGILGHEFALRH